MMIYLFILKHLNTQSTKQNQLYNKFIQMKKEELIKHLVQITYEQNEKSLIRKYRKINPYFFILVNLIFVFLFKIIKA